jgi:hypothetical protein
MASAQFGDVALVCQSRLSQSAAKTFHAALVQLPRRGKHYIYITPPQIFN